MFLHMLSDEDKNSFLKLAKLLTISDDDLHWDGKTLEELTGNVDLKSAAFRLLDTEKAILDDFARECGKEANSRRAGRTYNIVGDDEDDVESQLLQKLVLLPLSRMNAANERIQASSEVMKAILQGTAILDAGLPSTAKVMLYELMLLALADGEISVVESALLKQFAALQGLDDYIHDDLLERAESMNHEAGKAVALILE